MMYLSNIEKFFKNDSENLYLKFIRSEQALLKFIAFYSLERLKKKIFYYLLITKKYLILLKLENTMNYYYKIKTGELIKHQKLYRIPKKSNKKYVTLRQPKGSSNSLKPIIQVNIISQEVEIV